MSYLILSLKWTKCRPEMVWYKPKSKGYTVNIEDAGLYSREEAIAETIAGVTLAVDVEDAFRNAVRRVPHNFGLIERWKRECPCCYAPEPDACEELEGKR
jgi:hypothetical protein